MCKQHNIAIIGRNDNMLGESVSIVATEYDL